PSWRTKSRRRSSSPIRFSISVTDVTATRCMMELACPAILSVGGSAGRGRYTVSRRGNSCTDPSPRSTSTAASGGCTDSPPRRLGGISTMTSPLSQWPLHRSWPCRQPQPRRLYGRDGNESAAKALTSRGDAARAPLYAPQQPSPNEDQHDL